MSKELEALEKLICTFKPYIDMNYLIKEDFDIIETALKRLEKIETTTHSVLREDISKKLKALEIIKEKRVDVNCFIIYDLKRYNDFIAKNEFMTLTQEEFDLLKEVLKINE